MPALNKKQIISADDLPQEKVYVPEWAPKDDPAPHDWYVFVKTMTAEQRDDFESSQIKFNKKGLPEQNLKNVRARLVALVMVDESGTPLFSGTGDIWDLGRKSAKALDRIFEKAQDMNGLSDEDLEKLSQDFGHGPASDSRDDSPSDSE